MFAPPSARRNFFKCAPLTWNPGSAPADGYSRNTSCALNLISTFLLYFIVYWLHTMVSSATHTHTHTSPLHGQEIEGFQCLCFFLWVASVFKEFEDLRRQPFSNQGMGAGILFEKCRYLAKNINALITTFSLMIFVYFEEKKKHCEINTGRHRWTYICNTPPPPQKKSL